VSRALEDELVTRRHAAEVLHVSACRRRAARLAAAAAAARIDADDLT